MCSTTLTTLRLFIGTDCRIPSAVVAPWKKERPWCGEPWDYKSFGNSGKSGSQVETPERVPLVFEKKFAGHHWVDKWTINGK